MSTFSIGCKVKHHDRKYNGNYTDGVVLEHRNRRYGVKFEDRNEIEFVTVDKIWIQASVATNESEGEVELIRIQLSFFSYFIVYYYLLYSL